MQTATLSARKLALMVAHGFDETQFVNIQKFCMQNNAQLRVVSATAGLVNASAQSAAPMSYPVDAGLSGTLAVDYDALLLIEGTHLEVLKKDPHAGRIIRAFVRSEVPILSIGSAATLLDAHCESISADDIQALHPAGRKDALLFAADKENFSAAARHLADAISDARAAQIAEDEDQDDSQAA